MRQWIIHRLHNFRLYFMDISIWRCNPSQPKKYYKFIWKNVGTWYWFQIDQWFFQVWISTSFALNYITDWTWTLEILIPKHSSTRGVKWNLSQTEFFYRNTQFNCRKFQKMAITQKPISRHKQMIISISWLRHHVATSFIKWATFLILLSLNLLVRKFKNV